MAYVEEVERCFIHYRCIIGSVDSCLLSLCSWSIISIGGDCVWSCCHIHDIVYPVSHGVCDMLLQNCRWIIEKEKRGTTQILSSLQKRDTRKTKARGSSLQL